MRALAVPIRSLPSGGRSLCHLSSSRSAGRRRLRPASGLYTRSRTTQPKMYGIHNSNAAGRDVLGRDSGRTFHSQTPLSLIHRIYGTPISGNRGERRDVRSVQLHAGYPLVGTEYGVGPTSRGRRSRGRDRGRCLASIDRASSAWLTCSRGRAGAPSGPPCPGRGRRARSCPRGSGATRAPRSSSPSRPRCRASGTRRSTSARSGRPPA